MFDENFSFLARSADNTTAYRGYPSADVSPLASRCSSPKLAPCRPPPLADALSFPPARRRDSRYNSITSIPSLPAARQPSITALTTQFENHSLLSTHMPSSATNSSCTSMGDDSSITTTPTTPTSGTFRYSFDSDLDLDEGFVDGPDLDPSLWALGLPPHGASTSAHGAVPSFALRRRQRQALMRLQCLAQRAPDLMVLLEERHPSDLPLADDLALAAWRKRGSIVLSPAAKLDKERPAATPGGVRVGKGVKMRKRTTR